MLGRGLPPLTVLLALALVVPGAALAAPTESYQTALSQIDAGIVIRGVVNSRPHRVEVLLRDRKEYFAVFPPHGERALLHTLHAHGAKVVFASNKRGTPRPTGPVHHHIRYIAAGILAALIAAGGSILLFKRRRQRAGAET